MPISQRSIAITDHSSIGEARRSAIAAGQSLGLSEEQCSNVGIVSTEAATNMLLHAHGGDFLVCPTVAGNAVWLDLIAVDSGPGIPDIDRAMEDGFSTQGTAGQGLGAIARMSEESSLYTLRDRGTVYWSRFTPDGSPPAPNLCIANVPIHGETVCGDGYLVLREGKRDFYMVVDGLGHGLGAANAAAAAVEAVLSASKLGAPELLVSTHEALRSTRGAAMSIAIVDTEARTLRWAGVGNVGGMLVSPGRTRSFLSQNGTLGAILPRSPQEVVYPLEQGQTLLMFSDGLNTRLSIGGYPGILNRAPALLAALLHRDFSRKRDDATVLVAPLGGTA